jgi:hypothetical protein
MRSMRRVVAGVAMSVVLMLHQTPASADHAWQTYFPPIPSWPGWNTAWPFGSMSVVFTGSFPDNQLFRDRVHEAHLNWPQASTGRPPVYFYQTTDTWLPQYPCTFPDNWNGVYLEDSYLLGPAHATTYFCDGNNPNGLGHWSAQMVFNSDFLWWVSNSQPSSIYSNDLEGVATYDRRTTKSHDRSTMWNGFLNQYP